MAVAVAEGILEGFLGCSRTSNQASEHMPVSKLVPNPTLTPAQEQRDADNAGPFASIIIIRGLLLDSPGYTACMRLGRSYGCRRAQWWRVRPWQYARLLMVFLPYSFFG